MEDYKRGPKRTPDQVRTDRLEVAKLYLKGWTQHEIAKKFNVVQSQISYDMKKIRAEWLKAMLGAFGERQAQELAKIDALEVEYWRAWERSCQEKQTTRTKKRTGRDSEVLEAGVEKVGQAGDPRFLAGVQWCIDQRCKICGFNAPTKIAPTNPDGTASYGSLTDQERLAGFNAILARLGQGGVGLLEYSDGGNGTHANNGAVVVEAVRNNGDGGNHAGPVAE